MRRLKFLLLVCAILCTTVGGAQAEEVLVAVDADFSAPVKVLAANFEKETGYKVQLVFDTTNKFYSRIKNGAPYEVFLASGHATPAKLEQENCSITGSRCTYATGRLALWSPKVGYIDERGLRLTIADFKHLAIADPKSEPHGQAALETLTTMKLLKELQAKFVQGENLPQTYQFVADHKAELGFVAAAQIVKEGKIVGGSGWIVPSFLHQPIRHEAVLLEKGRGRPAALAWMNFIKTDKAKALIRPFGYET